MVNKLALALSRSCIMIYRHTDIRFFLFICEDQAKLCQRSSGIQQYLLDVTRSSWDCSTERAMKISLEEELEEVKRIALWQFYFAIYFSHYVDTIITQWWSQFYKWSIDSVDRSSFKPIQVVKWFELLMNWGNQLKLMNLCYKADWFDDLLMCLIYLFSNYIINSYR